MRDLSVPNSGFTFHPTTNPAEMGSNYLSRDTLVCSLARQASGGIVGSNRWFHLIALVALGLSSFLLSSCGGSSAKFAPTPTGGFTNASLSGSYAFEFSGTNFASGGLFGGSSFEAIAGSFQADGNGNITSGLEDVNGAGATFSSVPFTGTYTISADGRGTATLNSASLNPIDIAFVLTSNQHALIVRFDSFATASGSMDQQDPAALTNATLQQPFAFNLSGSDSNLGNLITVGNFIGDASGNVTGTQDVNDEGTVSTALPVTGTYALGTSGGRGVLTLTTSLGSLDFAFYLVNSGHLKLVELDSAPVIAGDAFLQPSAMSNTSISGGNAFTLAGIAGGGSYVAGGVFTADGNGGIPTGVEDVNVNTLVTQNASLSGSYSVAANGRATLTLSTSSATRNYAAYPSNGGLQMLDLDSSVTASGMAFAQQARSFSSATFQGNYGANFTGLLNGGEFDFTAEAVADGNGGLKGAEDLNLSGALSQGLAFGGSYSIGANGRGTGSVQTSSGKMNLAYYAVSNSRVLAIELDSQQVATGEFDHQ